MKAAEEAMVVALVDAHSRGDAERFRQIARGIALKDHQRARVLALTTPPTITVPRRCETFATEIKVSTDTETLLLADDLAHELEELASEHAHREALFARGVAPRSRVLLHGPPGNGKTSAAKMLAALRRQPCFLVECTSMLESYMGNTAARVHALAELLAMEAVVVLNEFDTLAVKRADSGESGAGREYAATVNALLTLLEAPFPALFVATTNRFGAMDPAVLRRMDDCLEFPVPTAEQGVLLAEKLAVRYGVPASLPPVWGSFDDVEKHILRAARRSVLAGASAS